MSQCPAKVTVRECTQGDADLECFWDEGHELPHLDQRLHVHWFSSDEIPGELQPTIEP
jgi:hypothetical protein